MNVDWAELFRFSVPPAELIVRGTAMYLFLFVLFRVVIKRRIGAIGMADLLVLVIVADAAQRVLWKNLRVEFVTEDELKAKLRERGVTDPKEVEKAYLESGGEVTVIRKQ